MFERKRCVPLFDADDVSIPQSGSPAYCELKSQPLLPSSASSEKTTPVPGGGAAFTVRPNVTLWLFPPLVPVKVSVALEAAAEAAAAMVTSSLPDPCTLALAKLTVTPAGAPETESATSPAKPLLAPIESVACVEAPAWSETEPGATETLKSGTGAAVTVRFTVAE